MSVATATITRMASPNNPSAPSIPSDAPRSKFVRYVRATTSNDYTSLFPITPATRPIVVGLDLRTLGPSPADYEELVHVLRRDVVTPKLMLFGDDTGLAEKWIQACEVEDRYVIEYTDRASAGRFADAMEFGVSTMRGEEQWGWQNCRTFDVYSEIDAHNAPTPDLTVDDRIRAAVLAAAGYGLGTDVIVSLWPTVGRADVSDRAR